MIYLDYTANTPCDPQVLECFMRSVQEFPGNPNSQHAAGKAARAEMDRRTVSIAELLGVTPPEIIYTSGASESNNTAIKGITRSARHLGKHIISTTLEHSSVGACLTWLQNQGYEVDLLDITREGVFDPQQIRELIRKDTVLVCLSLVDSELGTVQPIKEVAEILKSYPNCRLHVDATQAYGKIPVDLEGIDTVSLAPHKFYGLNGSGLLVKRRHVNMEPLINGGASTTLYRSGTPDLANAAACEEALRLAVENLQERASIVKENNTWLREQLKAIPQVRINSPVTSVPHILNMSVKDVKGTVMQRELDARGICVSVKSACSVDGAPSKAVFAVSRDRRNALSSFRVSISHLTTREELEAFVSAVKEVAEGKFLSK